jgi:sugar phosphate isomerase/epimerase
VKLAVFTDALDDRSLDDALDWIAAELPEVAGIELGVGGYSPAPHCDLDALESSAEARERLLATLARRGLDLCALNVSGNPLHPDPAVAERHHEQLARAIRVSADLGVSRLVVMSGCPGAGPGEAPAPHFVGGGWLPDLEGVLDWQWSERVLPYWRERAAEAGAANPELRLCFELHPGTCVYNVHSFEWIAELSPNLAVNLDPSHFFWQGIDPLAVVERLGERVCFVHAKDTLERPGNLRMNGVMDARWPGRAEDMPWNFATVGRGHDRDWWARFLAALDRTGYDGAVSIEWEDPFVEPEASIRESAALLRDALVPDEVRT